MKTLLGRILCAVGLHKWGKWYAEPEFSEAMGVPTSEFRWCQRDASNDCHTCQTRPLP